MAYCSTPSHPPTFLKEILMEFIKYIDIIFMIIIPLDIYFNAPLKRGYNPKDPSYIPPLPKKSEK